MAKRWAFGTQLKRDGDVVAGLNNIGGINLDRDEVDITSHDSADEFEEVGMTLRRAGTVAVSGFMDDADADGQQGLLADYNDGTLQSFEIVLPNGIASWTFSAYVKGVNIGDQEVNGFLPFAATLRIQGKPTLALTMSGGLSALTGVDSAAGGLTFVPVFVNDTHQYAVAVAHTVTWVKLTPTAASHTITINGNTVGSGSQSGEIALGDADSTTEITIVAWELNKVPVSYKILVARAAS